MKDIPYYWEFHKSTLLINWAFSIALSLMSSPLMIPIMTISGGPFISLLYREISRKNEYYFYYNRGITKIRLIVISMVFNALTSLIFLIALLQCQTS
jgi:ABC-type Na+ efflux pump permease subunit